MKVLNEMRVVCDSRSSNESFLRVAVSAFATEYDPTVEEIQDIKTAVSEAVTNCIVHGYPDKIGKIYMTARMYENGILKIYIKDKGVGIPDVKKAREPMFTTVGASGERSGLGFTVMESFCDKVQVRSTVGRGTTVILWKNLKLR